MASDFQKMWSFLLYVVYTHIIKALNALVTKKKNTQTYVYCVDRYHGDTENQGKNGENAIVQNVQYFRAIFGALY